MRILVLAPLFVFLPSCGGSTPPPASTATATSASTEANPTTQNDAPTAPSPATLNAPTPSVPPPTLPAAPPPTAATNAQRLPTLFATVKADLMACYTAGKKKAPNMGDGRVVLHAAVDDKGRTTCVVPSDDQGLTHEVEECMGERIAKEMQPPGAGYELHLRVTNGIMELGETKAAPAIASVETHGLKGAGAVVQGLMPELRACVQKGVGGSDDLRVLYMGARVGRDGHVSCSATTAAEAVPPAVRHCMSSVLAKATFAPPTEKVGLVSIPLKLFATR